jgi:histidinol dehydrogenase
MKREVSADIESATRAIVDDVAARGDLALIEATRKFDRLDLKPGDLRITPAEIDAAVKACDAGTLDALKFARDRIEVFHRRQLPKDERFTDALGVELRLALERDRAVGLYAGGTAASSSVLMNAVPAHASPASRVVVMVVYVRTASSIRWCCGGRSRRRLRDLSASVRAGGALPVTEDHRASCKIVGPGNAYVAAAAKRLVFGKVGIDMIAGPSECL